MVHVAWLDRNKVQLGLLVNGKVSTLGRQRCKLGKEERKKKEGRKKGGREEGRKGGREEGRKGERMKEGKKEGHVEQ